MFTHYLMLEDGTRLFYKVYGSSSDSERKINSKQPTLILLHGGPGVVDHTLYEPYWSQFAGKKMMDSTLQVIFIDHRGCGRSFHERDGLRDYGDSKQWTLEQWGQDVHTFFSAFSLHKPIIAGISFGGVVAISCAVQFPSELGGLILSDTDARFDLEEVLDHFSEKVKNKGGDATEITRVRRTARSMFTNTTPETYSNYIKVCLHYCATNSYPPELIERCVKNEESAYIYNRNELTRFNYLPELSKIECQILVMTGDQNPVHTLESAKRTAKAIDPDKLNFKLFPGAGSPVYADRKEEVTTVVNEYLEKLALYNMKKKHVTLKMK